MCGRFHVSGWGSRAEPQVSSSSSWNWCSQQYKPPPPPGTGAPSSINVFLLKNWCSQQYKPPGPILWISSAGAHAHCGLSYSPGPSCSPQVAPWELRCCCAFLTSYWTFQAQRVLILTSLGKQLLDRYLAFLWVFSASEPADFLSSLPSLLSVFPVCGPSWGSCRRHTEKEPRPGLGCRSQCTLNTHLSLLCAQRNSAGKELGELE